MSRRGLSGRATGWVERYQGSERAHRAAGCCRFEPSCSRYAHEALQTRVFPVALAMIVGRLVRCNPLTRRMTHDPVVRARRGLRPGAARTLFAALMLGGFVFLLSAGGASADPVTGGCKGSGNGRSADSMTRSNPLVLKEGTTFTAEGKIPAQFAGTDPRSVTHVEIFIVKGLFSRKTEDHVSTGDQWSSDAVKVDDYFNRDWGLGLYKFDIVNAGPGWTCHFVGYVELDGNPLSTPIGAAGAAGTVVGAAGVVGAGFAKKKPGPLDVGFDAYDAANPPTPPSASWRSPEVDWVDDLEEAVLGNLAPDERRMVKRLFGPCCTVALLMPLAVMPLFGAGGGGGAAGAVVWQKIVWRRGRPVLGTISGLFLGLGATILLWQYAVWTLTVFTAIVFPLVVAGLGLARALVGTPYRLEVQRVGPSAGSVSGPGA